MLGTSRVVDHDVLGQASYSAKVPPCLVPAGGANESAYHNHFLMKNLVSRHEGEAHLTMDPRVQAGLGMHGMYGGLYQQPHLTGMMSPMRYLLNRTDMLQHSVKETGFAERRPRVEEIEWYNAQQQQQAPLKKQRGLGTAPWGDQAYAAPSPGPTHASTWAGSAALSGAYYPPSWPAAGATRPSAEARQDGGPCDLPAGMGYPCEPTAATRWTPLPFAPRHNHIGGTLSQQQSVSYDGRDPQHGPRNATEALARGGGGGAADGGFSNASPTRPPACGAGGAAATHVAQGLGNGDVVGQKQGPHGGGGGGDKGGPLPLSAAEAERAPGPGGGATEAHQRHVRHVAPRDQWSGVKRVAEPPPCSGLPPQEAFYGHMGGRAQHVGNGNDVAPPNYVVNGAQRDWHGALRGIGSSSPQASLSGAVFYRGGGLDSHSMLMMPAVYQQQQAEPSQAHLMMDATTAVRPAMPRPCVPPHLVQTAHHAYGGFPYNVYQHGACGRPQRATLPQRVYFIGIYGPEERKERLERFHEKRKKRVWGREGKVYLCRKEFANVRKRVHGRFVGTNAKISDDEDEPGSKQDGADSDGDGAAVRVTSPPSPSRDPAAAASAKKTHLGGLAQAAAQAIAAEAAEKAGATEA